MISVVIPAFNEEENLPLCLEALAQQAVREPFEVIVVDSDSTDDTVAVARAYAKRLDLRVLNESRRGRGAARARGFRDARGDVILSTDADATVPPGWIEQFATAARDKRFVAATGTARINDCRWWTRAVFNAGLPILLQCNRLLYGHVGLSGYGFSIRKGAYEAAGGFDPAADAYEDLELGMRVSKVGRIKLIVSPRITFSGRRFKNGLLRGCSEYLRAWRGKFLQKKRSVPLSNVK